VVVDAELPMNRSVMVLELAGGGGVVTVTPAHAADVGLTAGSTVSAAGVLDVLAGAGVVMNDPDHLFYLPLVEQSAVVSEVSPGTIRALGEADAVVFGQFEGAVPADDLDEAFVELDHWAVFGSFDGDRLGCAASMIPWQGTRLADLGVITLPELRGRGLARRTVRALSAHALSQGYEPQYRCQLDNEASVALAAAAGFVRYGTWHVIASDE
jgi:GNAT superfamily N-acetyltransferase